MEAGTEKIIKKDGDLLLTETDPWITMTTIYTVRLKGEVVMGTFQYPEALEKYMELKNTKHKGV